MRASTLVQLLAIAAILAGLVVLIVTVSSGWADWVVLGVIFAAALGGALAVWNRQYPTPTQKRRFSRDSSSRW